MAIFRPQRAVTGIPYGMFENPGKLYIEGQAHDVTTLAPIFNDTTVLGYAVPSVGRGASPLLPMKSKQYFVGHQPGTFGAGVAYDTTYFDNNQSIASNVKVLSNKADTLAVSQTVWGSSIVPMTLVNSKTGNQVSTFPAVTTGYSDGHSVIFYEGGSSLLSFMQHSGPQGPNISSTRENYKIVSTNMNTGAATSLVSMNTGSTAMVYGSIVHESATDFFFISTSSSSTTVLSAVNQMNIVSKTGVVTTLTLPARTNNNPAYRPTKAIAISDTKRIIYLPEATTNATGDLFKFSTYEINTAAATTQPVHVSVTPTNATSMSGTVVNLSLIHI